MVQDQKDEPIDVESIYIEFLPLRKNTWNNYPEKFAIYFRNICNDSEHVGKVSSSLSCVF